jgi:hypothetical protein
MKNSRDPSFPPAPWLGDARDQLSENWRAKSAMAIEHIFDGIHPSYNGVVTQSFGLHLASRKMIQAIFQENGGEDPDDRLALIGWLGRAVGFMTDRTGIPILVHGSLRPAVYLSIRHWTISAWQSAPKTACPWATEYLENIVGVGQTPAIDASSWRHISKETELDKEIEKINAQADLMIFLRAFEKETARNMAPFEKLVTSSLQSENIANYCVALRILNATTDLVDPEIMPYLKFFESLYSHKRIDPDILRMLAAEEDRKILTNQGELKSQENLDSPYSSRKRTL